MSIISDVSGAETQAAADKASASKWKGPLHAPCATGPREALLTSDWMHLTGNLEENEEI